MCLFWVQNIIGSNPIALKHFLKCAALFFSVAPFCWSFPRIFLALLLLLLLLHAVVASSIVACSIPLLFCLCCSVVVLPFRQNGMFRSGRTTMLHVPLDAACSVLPFRKNGRTTLHALQVPEQHTGRTTTSSIPGRTCSIPAEQRCCNSVTASIRMLQFRHCLSACCFSALFLNFFLFFISNETLILF
jgi:hypothetical protein